VILLGVETNVVRIRFGESADEEGQQGESILEFARRINFPIASGCFNGGCGVCKIHLSAGRVQLNGPLSRKHVSSTEENLGYTLACRAIPQTDVVIDQYTTFRRLSAWQVTTEIVSVGKAG
jgi:ferredoxin